MTQVLLCLTCLLLILLPEPTTPIIIRTFGNTDCSGVPGTEENVAVSSVTKEFDCNQKKKNPTLLTTDNSILIFLTITMNMNYTTNAPV